MLLLLTLLACAKRPPTQVVHPSVVTTVGEDGSLSQLVDWDMDGRVDVRNEFATPAALSRRAVDTNGDGRIDLETEFDAVGRASRVERDGDLDGLFDTVEHYMHGELRLREIDSDGDGTMDREERFVGGVLVPEMPAGEAPK